MRVLVFVLLFVTPALAAGSDPVVLVDFETGEPTDGWSFSGIGVAEVRVEEGKTPSGGRALTLVGEDDRQGRVGYIYRLVTVNDWRRFRAFSLHAKVEAKRAIQMRVIGWDGRGRRGILRRFTLEPGDWREVLLPLATWREEFWDYVGDFRRVAGLEVRWDEGTGEVTIDDLRLIPGTRDDESCRPTDEARMKLAFPDGKGKVLETEDLRIVTDATRFKGREGKRLLARLEEVGVLLRERYGVTGETDQRVNFLVFRKPEDYRAYFPRLGKEFGATIREPTSDGYSALDVVGSTYSAEHGWKRPVYVTSNGNWVQEALANAVQMSIYPESAARVNFLSRFAARRDGVGPFEPLAKLCGTKRPGSKTYAQLATISDYLAERHRDKLEQVWEVVREHDKRVHEGLLDKIAAALGTTVADLQADWIAWGIEKHRSKK